MNVSLNSAVQVNAYQQKLNEVKKTEDVAAAKQGTAEVKQAETAKADYDVYESTMSTPESRAALVDHLKAEQQQIQERFLKTVRETLLNQGKEATKGDEIWKMISSGEITLGEEASNVLSSDGYWGADQTAQRILDFAKALAGDDPEMAETVKNAFIKGYKQAEEAWGGELPSVCGETYDKAMAMFDEWGQSAAA